MNKLIVLTGPTAVGKSRLSIRLAKEISAEIISADSMQVYKSMDIGTDKISAADRGEVRHHLIDILEPTDSFDVVLFQKYSQKALDEIYLNKHIPLIVGGTGFYIQSVLYDIDFSETDADKSARYAYEKEFEEGGERAAFLLHEKLRRIDEESADIIPVNNVKRVIRALEFFEKTGRRISEHNKEQRNKTSPYDYIYMVLTDEREFLYKRIGERIDEMIKKGLVDEVKALKAKGVSADMTSMQGIGYREILSYLDGVYDLDEAVYLIKRNTRHFAKRQLTWFKREKNVIWIDKSVYDRDEDKIFEVIKNKSLELINGKA